MVRTIFCYQISATETILAVLQLKGYLSNHLRGTNHSFTASLTFGNVTT